MLTRRRYVLRGIVQGVGFRPHVARVAAALPVTGFCGNDDESVFIEAQGEARDVDVFLMRVRDTLPPLARIESIEADTLAVIDADDPFHIVESERRGGAVTLVPPDMARCDDCLAEMNDPKDRRYRYPFISCTNCGPRFSIIRDVPYDRPKTTLAEFPMCPDCLAEYTDPLNRRFHAEPISCYACGPRLWLESGGVEIAEWQGAVDAARALIAAGKIVAVKGMGGFTLMCDARNESAVSRLRQRKHRPGKPLAVMTSTVTDVRSFARVSALQEAELVSPQRPIVLLPDGPGYDLATSIAPGLSEIGVMLPSAPVHDLLLSPGAVFVATSGNRSGEPLTYRNDDARRDLSDIADAFLINNRDIHVPVEDSVLLADGDRTVPIRRSRGFAPLPIQLGTATETVLAVGGELKNTFTITRDGMAFVSAHIGDMGALATQRAFERSVEQLLTAHRRTPALIVADRHPSYSTRAWAERRSERDDTPLLTVQHHHAHAASLLAEHGLLGQSAVCVVFDGTGFGTDGTIWGGEILRVHGTESERLWHLPTFGLPGGDSAVEHPWKAALALADSLGIPVDDVPSASAGSPAEVALVRSQLASGFGVATTSSAGRLFDAFASLVGVRQDVTYEAQSAMELESAARGCTHRGHASHRFDGLGSGIADLVERRRAGEPVSCVARMFHAGLAALAVDAAVAVLEPGELVGLTGGVFQNRILTRDVREGFRMKAPNSRILTHSRVPANDGGLSLGQAALGHLALVAEQENASCA